MRDIFTLFLHAIVTIIRLGKPGGVRSVVAESVLMRHQLLILNRGRKRAPNLRSSDRIIAGLCTLLMRPIRVLRSAVVLKPATLLNFHKMLVKQKYRLLFAPKRLSHPGPKGPTKELIDAVVEMKRRNRTWGYKRIAQQIALAFGVDIDKDVVRRILTTHLHPDAGSGGPSWLSFIGHAKDSLWSLDLFRCESAMLHSYWVLVVGSIYAKDRRLCRPHAAVDGMALCQMFNRAIHTQALRNI
jgi:putative transposase